MFPNGHSLAEFPNIQPVNVSNSANTGRQQKRELLQQLHMQASRADAASASGWFAQANGASAAKRAKFGDIQLASHQQQSAKQLPGSPQSTRSKPQGLEQAAVQPPPAPPEAPNSPPAAQSEPAHGSELAAPVQTITSASPELIAKLKAQKEAREEEKRRAQERAAEAARRRAAALQDAHAAEEEFRTAQAEARKFEENAEGVAGARIKVPPPPPPAADGADAADAAPAVAGDPILQGWLSDPELAQWARWYMANPQEWLDYKAQCSAPAAAATQAAPAASTPLRTSPAPGGAVDPWHQQRQRSSGGDSNSSYNALYDPGHDAQPRAVPGLAPRPPLTPPGPRPPPSSAATRPFWLQDDFSSSAAPRPMQPVPPPAASLPPRAPPPAGFAALPVPPPLSEAPRLAVNPVPWLQPGPSAAPPGRGPTPHALGPPPRPPGMPHGLRLPAAPPGLHGPGTSAPNPPAARRGDGAPSDPHAAYKPWQPTTGAVPPPPFSSASGPPGARIAHDWAQASRPGVAMALPPPPPNASIVGPATRRPESAQGAAPPAATPSAPVNMGAYVPGRRAQQAAAQADELSGSFIGGVRGEGQPTAASQGWNPLGSSPALFVLQAPPAGSHGAAQGAFKLPPPPTPAERGSAGPPSGVPALRHGAAGGNETAATRALGSGPLSAAPGQGASGVYGPAVAAGDRHGVAIQPLGHVGIPLDVVPPSSMAGGGAPPLGHARGALSGGAPHLQGAGEGAFISHGKSGASGVWGAPPGLGAAGPAELGGGGPGGWGGAAPRFPDRDPPVPPMRPPAVGPPQRVVAQALHAPRPHGHDHAQFQFMSSPRGM